MNDTITNLENEISTIRKQAESARAEYAHYSDSITNSKDFTPEAKRARIDDAKDHTKEQLRNLRAKEDQVLATIRPKLQSALFNSAGDVVAKRDAYDRAKRIESAEDAVREYDRAQIQKDSTLAVAILERAHEQGWNDFVTANFTDRGRREQLEALRHVDHLSTSPDASMNRALSYTLSLV